MHPIYPLELIVFILLKVCKKALGRPAI